MGEVESDKYFEKYLAYDMEINSVRLVYFSPTGTSKRVAEAIAKGIQVSCEHVDLTPPTARTQEFERLSDELAVIAAPVYAGRIPSEAVYRLRRISANDTPAVLVAVYGNRLYEDALVELQDLAIELGFRPVAGGAFIGEHSYSTAEVPTAHGRPDADDVEKAIEFSRKIVEKMSGICGPRDIPPLELPGNRPYREGMRDTSEPVEPITKEELYKKWKVCRGMPHLLYHRERCGHDERGHLYMVLRLRQELSLGCSGHESYLAEGFEMAEY